MNIELIATQNSDREHIWSIYAEAMTDHLEKMRDWGAEWQKTNFDKSLVEYKTSILLFLNERIGYLQTKEKP